MGFDWSSTCVWGDNVLSGFLKVQGMLGTGWVEGQAVVAPVRSQLHSLNASNRKSRPQAPKRCTGPPHSSPDMHMASFTTPLLICGMKEASQRESRSIWHQQQAEPQQPVRSGSQQVIESSPPQITWMLKLQPELLEGAFWVQHQESLTQADQQVFECICI